MKTAIFAGIAATLMFLTGCVNTDYVGESYEATTSVDVFYAEGDVNRPHTTMGKITATAVDGWDSDSMVQELKTQAMAKGADALIIQAVHTDTVGSYTSSYGNNSDPKWVVTKDGKLRDVSSGSHSSTSITTETKEKVMDAVLIKYQ